MAKESAVKEADAPVEEAPRPVLVRQLVQAPKDHWPEPRKWPQALLELLRDPRWPLLLSDFGLTTSTLSSYARKAQSGDPKAIAKLEPLKQVFIDTMGLDQHERDKYDDNNKLITTDDPARPGHIKAVTETRSRWGLRDSGRDMYHTAETGPRPRPAHWKRLVEQYFYNIATSLEFFKTTIPLQHGRKSPTLDQQRDALATVLSPDEGSGRESALKFIKPYLEGKKAEWNGRD